MHRRRSPGRHAIVSPWIATEESVSLTVESRELYTYLSSLSCIVSWRCDLEVIVQENESLDRALRRFKRKVQRSGLYSELRKRRFYEKPSAQRKRKREAAIRRERRRQRRGLQRRP